MKIEKIDIDGKKNSIEVLDKIFSTKINKKLVDNAKNLGEYLLSRLVTMSHDFPGFVLNPRGLGLFAAFDLPSSTERDKVCSKAIDEKLLILASGDQSVRFRPHLNVKKEEIDIALDLLYKVVSEILN